MKKILTILICAVLISSCQYAPKIKPERSGHYIPLDDSRQIIKRQPSPTQLGSGSSGFFNNESEPVKIALLVPLSGNYKELGQGLLDAAQLALFRVGDSNLSLVPIDTKDTPLAAAEAAKKAASEGAKIILGPVFSNAAKAVAKVAQENNIQVVSFSNDKSLAGSGAFAMGMLPEQQVSRIVEFALTRGIEDYAAVLPSDAYGAIAVKEMREVTARKPGASILRTELYQVGSGGAVKLDSHLKSAISAAMNSRPLKDYDKKTKTYNNNPIKYPRAVLLPPGGNEIAKIGESLAASGIDITKIQLLGTSQWYEPAVLNNPAFEGAWFAGSPADRRNDFEGKFKETYGYESPKLASLAYDGIALAATLARAGDFSRQALANPRGFMGVDGIFRLREDGLTERGLAVMQVQKGEAVIIDPAPANFVDYKGEVDNIQEEQEHNRQDTGGGY